MADARDSKSREATHEGSSPSSGTFERSENCWRRSCLRSFCEGLALQEHFYFHSRLAS